MNHFQRRGGVWKHLQSLRFPPPPDFFRGGNDVCVYQVHEVYEGEMYVAPGEQTEQLCGENETENGKGGHDKVPPCERQNK